MKREDWIASLERAACAHGCQVTFTDDGSQCPEPARHVGYFEDGDSRWTLAFCDEHADHRERCESAIVEVKRSRMRLAGEPAEPEPLADPVRHSWLSRLLPKPGAAQPPAGPAEPPAESEPAKPALRVVK